MSFWINGRDDSAMRMTRVFAKTAVLGVAIVLTGNIGVAAQAPAQGRGAGGRGGGPPAPPAAPTPRRTDGKPILGSVPGQPVGGWGAGVTTLPRGGALDEVPFQPWARAVYDIRQIDQFEPHTRCKASGVSRQFSTPYGTEFVEVPDLQRMYIMDNGGPDQLRVLDRALGGRHARRRNARPEREVLDRHTGNAAYRATEVHRTLHSKRHEHAQVSSDD
jgi:hypothetical protein